MVPLPTRGKIVRCGHHVVGPRDELVKQLVERDVSIIRPRGERYPAGPADTRNVGVGVGNVGPETASTGGWCRTAPCAGTSAG